MPFATVKSYFALLLHFCWLVTALPSLSPPQRTRVGGRFSYALYDELAPYAGAAWEYEFDGKARATTYGFDVPAPSLKGSTGVGELGISFTPNVLSQNAFAVDLGVQGYTGMRQGISGSVQLKFEF